MTENLVKVGYINNHTLRNIYWERFLENDMPEVVIKGVGFDKNWENFSNR